MKDVVIDISEAKTVEDTLKQMAGAALSERVADLVLTTGKGPEAAMIFPHMFSSVDSFGSDAFPLAPVMPVSCASAIRDVGTDAGDACILAVIRPCEARAALELSKMKQLARDNVILAVFDCMGTISGEAHRSAAGENQAGELTVKALRALSAGSLVDGCRESCLVCRHHSADDLDVDVVIGLAGIADQGMLLRAKSEKGAGFLEAVAQLPKARRTVGPTDPGDLAGRRGKTLSDLETEIAPQRAAIEQKHKQEMTGWEGLARILKHCVGCHACMRVCPICFCRSCFFESRQVRTGLDYRLRSADARGILALPTDKLFFHLGRMAHMSLSCVGCGLCEDTCRADVPVAALFRQASTASTAVFSYEAGRSLDEKYPLSTFANEELQDVVRVYEPWEV